MDLREMVRHRASLVRIRTSLNRIHAYLLMHGLKMEGTPFSKVPKTTIVRIEASNR